MRATKIFLSYAQEDRGIAQKLYLDLKDLGFEPWLDEKYLLGGQNWKAEIKKAIEESSFFLALFSTNSKDKRGYVQKELKIAVEIQDEFPDSQIFIIPVRLDECIPSNEKLKELQWVDLFPDYTIGLDNILKILQQEEKFGKKTTQKSNSGISAAKLLLHTYFENVTSKSNRSSLQEIFQQRFPHLPLPTQQLVTSPALSQ